MGIKSRSDLVKLIANNAFVLELGVAEGAFASELLMKASAIKYFGVDKWNDHHDYFEYFRAWKDTRWIPTGVIGDRYNTNLFRMTFTQALKCFKSIRLKFDLIYIDGYAHTGQQNGRTLYEYWPLLREGGIFAGHDYCDEYHKTKEVVDKFVKEKALELNVIQDTDTNPSWWVRK